MTDQHTLRDAFALAALPALLTSYHSPAAMAARAYEIADAMLAQRNRTAVTEPEIVDVDDEATPHDSGLYARTSEP